MSKKDALRAKFSADYKRYYLVDLFKREGFIRKKCESCGRFFWTLDPKRERCDDPPCSPYSFIGDPPTKKKLGMVETWRTVERFFVKNGHHSVKRYPVVSRWRPDLYFTVASIIDFQRVEGGKVVFQLPANPLIVPQVCLRFNDIPSVGVSGKHYTAFVMMGQTCIDNKEGYWKDKCVDLDFQLLTEELGVPPKEVTFNEDVWMGYGAFGYSLEYFVRGLEMGNAVFTAFEGDVEHYVGMKEKVVDMGAGLQRWAWLTQGTPTSYDANLASVLKSMNERCDVRVDEALFLEFSKLAGSMNIDEYGSLAEPRRAIARELKVDPQALERQLAPREALYAVADHAQTLLFGIADGMLPSNSGGGYNLRVLFRRAMGIIGRQKFPLTLEEVVNWHIDYLRRMYPELEEHRDDVADVLKVEESRYSSSAERVSKIVSAVTAEERSVPTQELLRLYDSDGVTPEQLLEAGANVEMPEDFYERVQERHTSRRAEPEKAQFPTEGLPPTKLLYYEDDAPFRFRAKVLKVLGGDRVVLDKTVFYPRGGGQEPDRGTIGGAKVVDVVKYGDVVMHRVDGKVPKPGPAVCQVEERRRRRITQIHTATHILNGSARQALGPWVWQHSAFKEEDYGRLDITHFSHLTEEEVQRIEDIANGVVRADMRITNTFMQRQDAERKYGFRLYQGGVVPGRLVRVVNIGGWDIEACGGTHAKSTGQVGLVKITRVERIQDGVERIEFVAGEAAVEYMHKMDSELQQLTAVLGTQRENLTKVARSLQVDLEAARSREKSLGQTLSELSAGDVASRAMKAGAAKLYVSALSSLGEGQIIAQGQKSVASEPSLIYLSFFPSGSSGRIVCFVGSAAREAGFSAGDIVRKLAPILGGSGGGSPGFAQGGGPLAGKLAEAAAAAEKLIAGPS